MSRVAIVIPARYASTRLPGKPLLEILGKPMIQHVYERALEVTASADVVVATDDIRIADCVRDFGGRFIMTSILHNSGTDRLVEVSKHFPADIYINLQGDEPLVRPDDITLLAHKMLDDPEIQVGTLCHELSENEVDNPNHVKVVLSNNGDALYFSRSRIPYPRNDEKLTYLKHIGVYAYRRDVLSHYNTLPSSALEDAESLEQLRLLSEGIRIKAFKVPPTGPGVDTEACLDRVRAIMSGDEDPSAIQSPLSQIKLVITDVDGVLTDGSIIYNETGECLKIFHVRDGLGIRMLEESGIRVAVLSGRDSPTLRKRVKDLGISLASFGVKDKSDACLKLMAQAGVPAHQTVCIGDDSIDLPAFSVCGISYAVADAPSYVKRAASYVLKASGGNGAFRELSDEILKSKNLSSIYDSAQGFKKSMSEPRQ
ncbi:3-deoxy-manno-octulosonate cytidylyltransferase [Brachymonas sp. J145]|uniref:3-deoxy-manno-octulosonate cytidylyltransferase n=1 Tax=Brachymonas sp. J145 TaxID=3116489 RepID=UPI002E763C76|nr:3-deoxy-manno-octulosonate cytidylyltransferase [Brachymonas sp. J145]MEE1653407.1 3-deoxy-manno-octulosonate cytidylyltransferase [Brachymonas sp. J145]